MQVAVVGAGTWGTTVAHLCAHNATTTLWTRNADVAESVTQQHLNQQHLPDYPLHPLLTASTDITRVVDGADVVVMGVASAGFTSTLDILEPAMATATPVVSLTKGLDHDTGQRMTEMIADRFPESSIGVLTGPNLAKEILAKQPAASVLAFDDITVAQELQPLFTTECFRVYTSPDLIGCELGGALKNVIAIAVGIADGLGAGDNTKAALITRGLAELARLGVAMGGQPETFGGLTGMGDLVATSTSPQSRNRSVGVALGAGRSLAKIVDDMGGAAEGIKSAPIVVRLGQHYGVDLPICNEVCAVVVHGRSVEEAYQNLMSRPQRGTAE